MVKFGITSPAGNSPVFSFGVFFKKNKPTTTGDSKIPSGLYAKKLLRDSYYETLGENEFGRKIEQFNVYMKKFATGNSACGLWG